MKWLEVSVRCGRAAQEAVSGALSEVTVGPTGESAGVAIEDPAMILGRDQKDWDYCDLDLGDPDLVTVKAYVPGLEGWQDSLARIGAALARIRELDLGPVEEPVTRWVAEADWAENWKQYFRPLRAGRRLVIVPSWEDYQPVPDDLIITLDPGMAFGTGTHATTRLCLEALEERLSGLGGPSAGGTGWECRELGGQEARVLDIGTGSGILALAAARLGAAEVVAIDTDPVALEVAARNFMANGLGPRRGSRQGDWRPGAVRIHLGDLKEWECRGGQRPFDIVVANIIAGVVAELAPEVRRLLKPGGLFIAGGIIDSKAESVARALESAGLRTAGRREAEGWVVFEAEAPGWNQPTGGSLA